jgi:inosine-uridine nucleoside N-ribohydrolase
VKPVGLHIQVETEGRVTLGQTLADRRSLRGVHRPPPNLRVVLKVDAARFLKLFRERLCPRRPP